MLGVLIDFKSKCVAHQTESEVKLDLCSAFKTVIRFLEYLLVYLTL